MTDPTATALNLDNRATLHRFTTHITPHTTEQTLHVYEHKNSFSIHGHLHTTLASRLIPDLPAPTNLSCTPPLPTIILDQRTTRDLIRLSLAAGHKATIWTVSSSDGRVSTRLSGSPGNAGTLEEFLGDVTEGAVLCARVAVVRGAITLGVAVWDVASNQLRTGQVIDDEMFSNFEALLIGNNVKEAVMLEADIIADNAKITDVLERCGVALTTHLKKAFDPIDVPQDLERLVGSKHTIASFLDSKLAMASVAALLDYLRLMADTSLESRVTLKQLDVVKYMQLDNAVMRALNILPYPGDGGKMASLYGLLNRTKSSLGARLLRKWLSQPLQDVNAINQRLDMVAAFVDGAEMTKSIREEHICKMPDINLLCRRFTKNNGAKANLQDVVRLYQCAIRLPFLAEELDKHDMLKSEYADPLCKLVAELSNFEALVETTIDLDQIDNGEFVVSPAVDPELQALREKQDAILAQIEREHSSVSGLIPGLKNDSLKLERKDNLGYIFRLTRKEEKKIRGKKQFTILETRKDGVRFQSRGLRRLSESYQSIVGEYQEKEKEMRGKTLEVATTYVEVFLDVSTLLAEVDVLCAFATVAVQAKTEFCRPILRPAGSGLMLKRARHPIVEENMDDDADFISNDLDLTRNCDEMSEDENAGGALLLVTGPNMGGKSTYIRCAGVLTLMAHVGCYLPAAEAKVPITDRIFARVGAGDNQHRAISTFMSEMLETAAILKSATSKSLVIIDELGRGTGTMDGYGLAYAISKHIAANIKSACLFATHFFELTALANDVSAVRNVHVSAMTDARSNKLTFLYEVQQGACDQSFGVHVAEMANFPISVVDAAKRKADELEGCAAPSKRRKTAMIGEEDKAEGQKLISKFLDDVRKLPMATDEEAQESVGKARTMRQRVMGEKNAYVMALLADS